MPDLRYVVLEALESQGRSRSWLADHPDVTCGRDAVLRWLAGRTDIAATHAGECLAVLGLDVTPPAAPAPDRP